MNFVLGEADFLNGCAVISFGHYASIANMNVMKNQMKSNEKQFTKAKSCFNLASSSSVSQPENCGNAHDLAFWRIPKVHIYQLSVTNICIVNVDVLKACFHFKF